MAVTSISSGLMTKVVDLGGFYEIERSRSFGANPHADATFERRLLLARVASVAISVFATAESCALSVVCFLSILLDLLDEQRTTYACSWLHSSLFTIAWGLDRAIFSRSGNPDLLMGEAAARRVLYRRYCETFPLNVSDPDPALQPLSQ